MHLIFCCLPAQKNLEIKTHKTVIVPAVLSSKLCLYP